ncbi:MAG: hypothetical protein LUC25_01820 [Ruminococcus sp.]|nr:hypothetical protein [Ruminococcus sp.]
MKKILALLLAAVSLLAFTACGEDEELTVEEELSEIEADIGEVCNDYLKDKMDKDEAYEELDALYDRTAALDDKAVDEVTVPTENADDYAVTEKDHVFYTECHINEVKKFIDEDKTEKIELMRDAYYEG